jgi:glycosyltransferase involved in cell wall biosynthesis
MTAKNPLVSVIIPTYNRCELVTKAIDSVLTQTYKNYEIIVVDDGSKDNTKEILQPYMDKIRYIYQENSGCSSARNSGIRSAEGEWIAFLDSDNQWLREKLVRQMECVQRTGSKACFTNFKCFDEKKEWQGYNCAKLEKQSVQEKLITDPYEVFLIGAPPFSFSTIIVSKSLLKEVGCFDESLRIGDDTRATFQLALKTPLAFIYSVQMMNNRCRSREGLVNSSLETIRERSKVQILILSTAYFREGEKSNAVISSLRHRLGHALSRRAEVACIDKQYVAARHFAKDALYFGNDLKTYLRSLAVWLWPRLAGKIYKRRWEEWAI